MYIETERILKDVIYFYASNLWKEKIEKAYEPQKKKETAESHS